VTGLLIKDADKQCENRIEQVPIRRSAALQ